MRVSLCIIARDEAHRLAGCIDSVRPLVSEIVVVDTGSTDGTGALARGLGARVFDFAWSNDFAAARNETLRWASRPWILTMDADDLLDEPNRSALGELFASLGEENAGYMMQCVSVDARGEIMSSAGHVRTFRNDPRIRWDHRVHEQIISSVEASGGRIVRTPIVVHHHGYKDPAELARKLERNMRLLDLEATERPLDPLTQYHRGSVLAGLGRLEEAIVALNLSAGSLGQGSLQSKRQGLLARCYFKTGARAAAAEVVDCARHKYPDDPDLLYTEAQLLLARGDLSGAEANLRVVLGLSPDERVDCLDCSIFGAAGFYLLSLCLALQGRLAETEIAARKATSLDPALMPGWVVLADALAEQGHLAQLGELALDPGAPSAARAMARACALALRGANEEALEALSPPVPGEHALLRSGRSWITLEQRGRRRVLDILRVPVPQEQVQE